MHYVVSARLKPGNADELLAKLTDGTIANQKPDGQEIVESMQRAKIGEDGLVHWSEVCYCPTPLQHERATVYDRHFAEFQAEPVATYVVAEGARLSDGLGGHSRAS